MSVLKDFFLGKQIIASNFRSNIAPYKLTFAVTYNCNSRCKTCNIWERESKNELTPDEIDKFFKENPDFLWIDITGGEIFLRSDLIKILQTIKNRCKRLHTLHFPTNGLMTNHIIEIVKQVIKLDFNKLIITVSVDGPPEIHEKIRGIKGGFKKTITTYKKLRNMKGVDAYIGMTLSKDNVDLLDETMNAIKLEIPVFTYKDLHINIAHSSPHFYGNKQIDFPVNKVVSTISSFSERKKFSLINPVSILEYQYLKRIRKYLKTTKCPMECHSLRSSIFLDPYGNVYPCTAYDKKIGNINSQTLKAMLSKTEVKKLANDIRKLNCPQCWTPCEAYQTILGNLFKFVD